VITDIEARNWALALRLGADPSTRNIDRILRLPGTINYPNAKKRKDGRVACEAVLLEYNDVAYSIDDFPVHVEPTKEEHTRDESRSGKAFRYMQDCMRRRMSYEATREAILNDDGEVGEWAREYEHEPDQRQFKRAWDKATAEAGSAGPHDWDDPDCSLLDDRRGDLPEFPLDVFDNLALADWISAAAHGTSTTVDHVAVPLLGIASSLIGTARRVQASKSFTQPMTCWTATVGFSGTGKSPGLTTIRRPLDDVADDYKIKVAELRRAHELKVEQAKAARAAWKRAFDVAIDKGRPPPPKPKAADEPGAVQAAEIAVLDYFWPHARACLRQIGLNPRNADARQVLHWIKTRGLFEVGREEIRREALARRLDAEGTQGVLDFLTALDGCEKRACRPKDARRCVGR
jgi:hypothetical protein